MTSARTHSNKRPYELSPPATADSKRLKHHASPPALPANFFSPTSTTATTITTSTTTSPPSAEPDLDAEWESFQRDVVAEPSMTTTAAVISAPPVPAKEDNAKQEEGVSEDTKDEKEEAQERLLEEFEEMEGLEERVRRLKERREALRRTGIVGGVGDTGGAGGAGGTRLESGGRERPGVGVVREGGGSGEEEEDEEEDEDEDEEDFLRR